MPKHVVQSGECLSSIAYLYGFSWQRLWDDSQNSQLRKGRRTPDVLQPGDEVFVPDRTSRIEQGAVERRHRFVRRGVPAKLRLRVIDLDEQEAEESQESEEFVAPAERGRVPVEGKPASRSDATPKQKARSHVPYALVIDNRLFSGTTDAEGLVEVTIPPNATEGRLVLEPGTARETTIPLALGHLNPLSALSGVKQRLTNLGFACGDLSDEPTPESTAALRAFQEWQGLAATGEADDTTRNKLRDLHGS